MRGHSSGRPIVIVLALLFIMLGTSFTPLLGGPGIASASVVDKFEKDRKSQDRVDLHFRPPSLKDQAGIAVPRDGQVIKGSFQAEATEWTDQGMFEHNTTEDFMTASSLQHVKVDNGTVRLEDVPAELPLSASNSWGHGVTTGLNVGDELSLQDASGMAFRWDNVLSNASNEQENVILRVDKEGVTHCIYEDNSKGLDVYYARSEDGLHYSDFKYLDTTGSRFIPQQSPAMVVDDQDRIQVVYADGRTTPNDLDIFYTMSQDHGNHFSVETRVDHGGIAVQNNPSVAVDGSGNIFVAWEDSRDGNTTIYFNKNFGTDTRVTMSHYGYHLQPKLAVDTTGTVHILWRDNRSAKDEWRIYHAVLKPGAATFTGEALVYWIYYGFDQYFPNIVAGDNGRVYIAWADNKTFEYNVYVSYSDDGLNFVEPVRVTPILVRALQPSIAYLRGTLHLIWYDFRDDGYTHIYYANSTDGKSFTRTVRVDHSNGTARQRSPAIAPGLDGWPRVAWVDFRQHQSGDLFTTKGAPNHITNGTLEVWADLGSIPYMFNWAEIVGELPAGTAVEVAGMTSPDNITWSAPVMFTNSSTNLTPDRYLHLEIMVKTNNSAITPYVSRIVVHYRRFAPAGTLVSMEFQMEHPVSKVTAEWGAPDGDDGITVSVSLDGGLSWAKLENGTETGVASSENNMEYKIDLARMAFGSPSVQWLKITYIEHSYPKDLSITIGDTRVWHFSGEFTAQASISDLAKAFNDYLGSLGSGTGSGEDNVTVPVEVTSGQLGDLALKGLSLDIALPPRITGSGPSGTLEVDEGQQVIFWVSVSERDGRPLTYQWTVNGDVLDNATNYTMTYIVPYTGTAPRTDTVSVEVSNGYLSVRRTWNLNVEPSNRPPVIESQMPELESVVVDRSKKMVDFQVNATDPDGDTLSYSWTLDGTEQGSNSDSYVLEASKFSAGDHVVRVEVSDGKASVSREWSVIILPAGRPSTDYGWWYVAFYAIIALIVILLCGISFMEAYRNAKGGRRALRKSIMEQEDGAAGGKKVPPAMKVRKPVQKKAGKARRKV